MTSQGPGLEILERLVEWSSEEIKKNIDEILQELMRHLSNEDKGHVLQSVYALLVTCLPSVSIEQVDECLLHHAMPAAQLLFTESLEGIKLRLDEESQSECEDIGDTLSSLLQVCIELLKCMDCVLQYVISQDNVHISSIPNVPKIVASLMLQTFKHCKESETLYGHLFSTVADVLGAVFRQCHQVQTRFFAVITSNIAFDCSVETDIVNLVDVLQTLSEIGEHVMSLDVKTMAEQWKGYAKAVQMYLKPLRDRLNVAYPINYLCLEITTNIEHLSSKDLPKDLKSTSRLVKTTSFILKIVVKLCEQFGSGNGCLGNSHSALYKLLLALHRYSPPLLMVQNVDRLLIDEIERHLTIAADPLLSHLLPETDFREEFFRNSKQACNHLQNCLPQLTLMLAVMKKLVLFSTEDKDLWIGECKDDNVVGCLLKILKFSHFELSSEIWLPATVKSGAMPRNCDLYEALCSHCAGLLLSFNDIQYQRVESMLMDSLLETGIWPVMFAGDVWCICARAGSSELVLDQILYFADIVSCFEFVSFSERVECKIIALFLQRMCSFLGVKGKQILPEKYPPSDHPLLWYIFSLACLPNERQNLVAQSLIANAVKDVQNFLTSSASLTLFNKMVPSLFGLNAALELYSSKKSYADVKQFSIVPAIISLWQYTCQSEHFCGPHNFSGNSKWLWRFFEMLCQCIENLVQIMSNNETLQVLCLVVDAVNYFSPSAKFSVMRIVRGLATKTLEITPNQELICSKISCIFASLLEDTNSLVKEAALETFEYFAHFTAHESIVAEAVADNIPIQEIVTTYLQKEIPVVESNMEPLSPEDYLMFQQQIPCLHKCGVKKQRNISPKSPEKPSKKMRFEFNESSDLSEFLADDLFSELGDKETSEAVNRIAQESQFLISQCSFQSLSIPLQSELKAAVEGLKKFMNV